MCVLLLVGPSAVADAASDEWAHVDEAITSIQTLVPGWVLPPAVTESLAAGDVEKAQHAASAAQRWVEAAHQAEQDLPEIEAMSRTQPPPRARRAWRTCRPASPGSLFLQVR